MINKLTNTDYLKRFKEITEEMYEITKAKNHDYSAAIWWLAFKNFELSQYLWNVDTAESIFVRMLDKISRISSLLSRPAQVADEKITDTLRDLSNYSIILSIYLETINN